MGVIVLATKIFPSAGRAWKSSVAVHTNGWVEVCTSLMSPTYLNSLRTIERPNTSLGQSGAGGPDLTFRLISLPHFMPAVGVKPRAPIP
jgi:hypothetical protein